MHSPPRLDADLPIATEPRSAATDSLTHTGSADSTPALVTGSQPRLAGLRGAVVGADPSSATWDALGHVVSDVTERVSISTVPELALSTILADTAPCAPCRIHACGARLPTPCTMHVDDKLGRRRGTSGAVCGCACVHSVSALVYSSFQRC